jgi:leucyl aminopeptidase
MIHSVFPNSGNHEADSWTKASCDILVVVVPDQWQNQIYLSQLASETDGATQRLLESGEVSTKVAKTTLCLTPPNLGAKQVLFVGAGSIDEWSSIVAARVAGAAIKSVASKARRTVRMVGFRGTPIEWRCAVVGASVASQGQDLFKTEKAIHAPESVEWLDANDEQLRLGSILGTAVNWARRLVNLPPNYLYPESFVDMVCRTLDQTSVNIEVWDRSRLEAERCGALLGVARGSVKDPRLMILKYNGNPNTTETTALVGKGVTFDSGGYSIKPTDGMLTMKCDMAGAATVVGILQGLAAVRAQINVIGIVGLVENLISGDAFKLGDVLTARSGKTIEIHNTDAEGRLVLADCLNVALDHKPQRIVDFATLTGACVVALGNDISGTMTNNSEWQSAIHQAAEKAGELVWPLPMHKFFTEQIAGKIADIKNVGEGRWGGAITAAKFLEEFVDKTPWTHIDIAGPAFLDSPKAWTDAGGSGTLVRTFIELLAKL